MLAYLRESPFKPYRTKFSANIETRPLARQVVIGEATSSETYSFPNSRASTTNGNNNGNGEGREGQRSSQRRSTTRGSNTRGSNRNSRKSSRLSQSPSLSPSNVRNSNNVSRDGINTATTTNPNASLSGIYNDNINNNSSSSLHMNTPKKQEQDYNNNNRDISSPTTHDEYEGSLNKGRKIENGNSIYDDSERIVVQYKGGGKGKGKGGAGGKGRPTPEAIQRRIKKFSKAKRNGGGRRGQTYVLIAEPILSDED